jgi:hypothetical protein
MLKSWEIVFLSRLVRSLLPENRFYLTKVETPMNYRRRLSNSKISVTLRKFIVTALSWKLFPAFHNEVLGGGQKLTAKIKSALKACL